LYAIVLAGGYAKRLWPLTQNTPKALLPIAGKPILDYIIDKLQALQPPLRKIVISTNLLFQPQFQAWLTTRGDKYIQFLADNTSSETEKPGAIKALADIIASTEDDDVLVLAGDGMFKDNLQDMLATFQRKNATVVALYRVNSLDEAKRCATITTDQADRIVEFTEKPAVPKTRLVCGAVYIFKKNIHKRFSEYLALGLPADPVGRFAEWLCHQEPVYGYMLNDYLWDIGVPEVYRACDEYFGKETR
jgi:glucose-1-phosphate thymidylyltransferase